MTTEEKEEFAKAYNSATGHHSEEVVLEVLELYDTVSSEDELYDKLQNKYDGISTIIDALIIWQHAVKFALRFNW